MTKDRYSVVERREMLESERFWVLDESNHTWISAFYSKISAEMYAKNVNDAFKRELNT